MDWTVFLNAKRAPHAGCYPHERYDACSRPFDAVHRQPYRSVQQVKQPQQPREDAVSFDRTEQKFRFGVRVQHHCGRHQHHQDQRRREHGVRYNVGIIVVKAIDDCGNHDQYNSADRMHVRSCGVKVNTLSTSHPTPKPQRAGGSQQHDGFVC